MVRQISHQPILQCVKAPDNLTRSRIYKRWADSRVTKKKYANKLTVNVSIIHVIRWKQLNNRCAETSQPQVWIKPINITSSIAVILRPIPEIDKVTQKSPKKLQTDPRTKSYRIQIERGKYQKKREKREHEKQKKLLYRVNKSYGI